MARNLKSIAAFASSGPQSEGGIRWQVFHSKNNGLDAHGALVRIGRRVFIDVDRYDEWVESQQPPRPDLAANERGAMHKSAAA